MRVPASLLVHTVTYRTHLGSGSFGETYAEPAELRCMARGKHRLVRDSNGEEVLSTLELIAAPGQAHLLPPGSEVTWRERVTTVIGSTDEDDGGLGAPQHTAVSCE